MALIHDGLYFPSSEEREALCLVPYDERPIAVERIQEYVAMLSRRLIAKSNSAIEFDRESADRSDIVTSVDEDIFFWNVCQRRADKDIA